MSAAAEEDDTDTMMLCASCGTAGSDDIKLMKCACKLVKYCSVKCQKYHRPQHKKECKKRIAELKDEILFKQPESTHDGDCPICCLPLPFVESKSILYSCCCKVICKGCVAANSKRETEGRLQPKCPFCRKALSTEEENAEFLMKRIEAKDPVAICHVGTKKLEEGDYEGAFKYWTKAAALGDAMAHYQVSNMYQDGKGGVEKDKKKELHHLKEAAIAGHPHARYNLACTEGENGRFDRAVKHFIIAAKQGHDMSLERLREGCKLGLVSKDDYAAALRGYQAAIEATKSPQREEAYKIFSAASRLMQK